MAFTSIGYDGTVNERQWAELVPNVGSSNYGIKDADDLKVTAVPGQPLMVSVASGTAWGHGVIDTETSNTTITCGTLASGTRWDLIALRRNWQPLAGGPTSVVVVPGTTSRAIPDSRLVVAGVEDDQPLALVQWTAGQTQPTAVVDLRCWGGNGGVIANDILALTYLKRPGASVTIAGVEWNCTIGENDTLNWVQNTALGRLPLFAVGNPLTSSLANANAAIPNGFLVQTGTAVANADQSGYSRVAFPKPFPNGVMYVSAENGDASIDAVIGKTINLPVAGSPDWVTPVTNSSFVYAVMGDDGKRLPGQLHRANWLAIGW